MSGGRLTPYAGNYDYYLQKSGASNERAALTAGFTDGRPVQAPAAKADSGAANRTTRSGPKTKEQKRAEAEARSARSAPLRAAKARVTQLEKEIASLEEQQNNLTNALEAPETYNEPGKAVGLNRELATVVARLEAATSAWEKASHEVAELES